MPKPLFTENSCSAYLFRDHKDALKCFGTLARCRVVYHTTNGFCVKLDMGWVEEQDHKDSLYSHIKRYLSSRIVRMEYYYDEHSSEANIGGYMLSIAYEYGKIDCRTLSQVIKLLISWEVTEIKQRELLTKVFTYVRRDEKISDDKLKEYLWTSITTYWRTTYHDMGHGWDKARTLAELKQAREYEEFPPYWPYEDESANSQIQIPSVEVCIDLN